MKNHLLAAGLALAASALGAAPLSVSVGADRTNNIYAVGEPIAFTVSAKEADGRLAATGSVEVLVDNFGTKPLVKRHRVDLATGNPFTVKARLDEPGFARLSVKVPGTNDVLWGVGVEPERIRQGGTRPDDFEAFWREAIAKYDRAVPEDVTLEKVEELSRKACDTYLVSLTTPHGRTAYGRLSVPKAPPPGRGYPLRLNVMPAGPSILSAGTRNDEIQFVMNVHYYRPNVGEKRSEANGKLQEQEDREWTDRYPVRSWRKYCEAGIAASREEYFFYDAILAIRRVFHWAARRTDVDAADITYSGGSQGGAFGIYMSALCPFIRRSCMSVPAITDIFGYRVGRNSGWPSLIEQQTDENRAAAERNAPYFDAVNFAPMVRCPVRFAVGFIDTTCAPTAVYSAYNALGSSDRRIYHGFGMGHSTFGWISREMSAWEREKEEKGDFIEKLIGEMTLEEKVGQLVQRGALKGWVDPVAGDATRNPLNEELLADIREGRVGALLGACGIENYNAYQEAARASRLKIPLLVGADLIHGCRTSYPIPLGLSCAWDEDLWRRAGKLISDEAPLVGCNWTFAPMVDIARDARWGRIAEGAGQDPFLGARFAAATVRGIQCDVPAGRPRVAATLKHFVGYGAAEGGRDYAAAEVTDSVLHDIYLPPFKGGIDAGALAVMPSFQTIDGVPLSVNRRLLTDALRGELGFRGLCVSDMGAVGECGPDGHAVAATLPELAALSVRAGMSIEMERRSNRVFSSALAAACREGKVLETEIDARVREVLRVKRRLGLFDDPLIDAEKVRREADTTKSRSFAREAATRAAVLLKNEKDVLPLVRGRRVALVGAAGADKDLLFGTWTTWTANPDRLTVEEGLRSLGMDLVYTPAYGQKGDPDRIDVAALERACASADVVVATFGMRRAGGEAQSRSDISLIACERRASEVIAASGKPFVAVLFTGIPVAIPELAERADAILEMWGAGSCAGIATADLLTGAASPSGRLTCDFPVTTGQCPIYYNHLPTGRPYDPSRHFSSRYVEGPNAPLYPFGFGLGYTTFAFSPTTASAGDGSVVLACTVTNTGRRKGRTVVQAYVRRLFAGRSTPVRELRGFEAVTLEPGEVRRVEIRVPVGRGTYEAVLARDSRTGDPVRAEVR